MWESRLKLLYPQRRFEVNYNQGEQSRVVVTFHQVRENSC